MALHRSRWSGRRVAIPTVIVSAVLLAAAGGIAAAVAPANAAGATWDPDTVITDAPGAASSLDAPNDVRYTRSGALLVADFAGNGVLRRDPDGTWSVLAPLGTDDRSMWNPSAVTETDRGTVLVAEAGRRTVAELDGHDVVRRFPAPGDRAVGALTAVGTTLFAAAPGSGSLWVTDTDTDTDSAAGRWSSVAGPWVDPAGVAVSPDGSTLIVSDQSTDTVWQVDSATGDVSSLGNPGDDPARVRLRGVAVLEDGSVVVADNGGGRVFVRTAQDPHSAERAIKTAIRDLAVEQPIVITGTLEEIRAARIAPSRVTASLMAGLGALALAIGAVGVFG